MYLLISYISLIIIFAWMQASLIENKQKIYHTMVLVFLAMVIVMIRFLPKYNAVEQILSFVFLFGALYDTALNLFRKLGILYFGENSKYDRFMKTVHPSLVVLWKVMALLMGITLAIRSKNNKHG